MKRYGDKVHEHLASSGLAPKLHKVVSFPGGLKAVIMNKVKGGSSLNDVSEDKLVENDWMLFRETLKKSLKEKSFVHVELRCQNILLSGTSQFAVVNFDWAGEYGDVKYPLDINLAETCGWASGVDCGVLIESSHDHYQLENLL